MNELMMHDPFMPLSNMFRNLEAMMDFDFSRESKGLRKWLKRPHNLITKKDENGKITSYQIQMVHTPFKRDEVKVEVLNGVLTVNCGSDNKVKDEDMDYCGISHQSYSFSLPLSDTVDTTAITAKAEDGMLYIDLPVKKIEEEKPAPLSIEVK
ncbi:MAG: Hsp20 family protein [Methanobrevibacter sp.]|nr:Hsp20 family protein [Methanobrevibacter sp.]